MPVAIDEAIRSDAAMLRAVERAEKIFSDILGVAVERVDRRWELARDSAGRTAVRLSVTDDGVSGETLFTAQQINNPNYLEDRLIKFWGDLLEDKAHKQLARLRQLVAALED
jgi:hypothetical protein